MTRHASGGSDIVVGGGREIAASAMAKLRASLSGADADDDEDSSSPAHVTDHSGHSGFHDFLAGLVVLGLIYGGWRIFRGRGGKGAVPNGAPAAPTDPGVVALCSLLAGLERRLAQVETHVTSREFELNRKFRDIEAGR